MAGTRKVGETIPLAVVGKDDINEKDDKDLAMTDDEKQTTIAHLNETLASLKAQVEQLSGSLAHATGKAGKAVAHGATAATDTVTTTVREYPFYAVAAASAFAFLLGRMSVTQPESFSDRAYGQLRDGWRGARERIPGNFIEQIRSSLR